MSGLTPTLCGSLRQRFAVKKNKKAVFMPARPYCLGCRTFARLLKNQHKALFFVFKEVDFLPELCW